MNRDPSRRTLSVIVCGAGPATAIGTLVKLARDRGWTVQVIATPAALEFFDADAIEELTGSPVRSQYRKPGEPRSEIPAAIIVAPATYNTINKWAQGISDTYALGILAETTALERPDRRPPLRQHRASEPPAIPAQRRSPARRRRADSPRPWRHRAAPAPHGWRSHRQLPLASRPGRSRPPAQLHPTALIVSQPAALNERRPGHPSSAAAAAPPTSRHAKSAPQR